MNKERLDYLFKYFELLTHTPNPDKYDHLKKVASEIDKELKIDEQNQDGIENLDQVVKLAKTILTKNRSETMFEAGKIIGYLAKLEVAE